MSQSSVKVSKKLVLHVPRKALWDFLSDTDRLNKAVGLPAIEFTPHPDQSKKGYYKAKAKLLGVKISYEELPYDWVEQEYFHIVRQFKLPFIREIGVVYRFHSVGNETELEVEIEVAPNNIVTTFIAKVILAKVAFRDVFNVSREFEKQYHEKNQTTPPSYEAMYSINEPQLHERFDVLNNFALTTSVVKRLQQHIQKGSEIDVVRMRPFELADKWNEDRYDTLKTFITATKAGALDLHWTVLCPNCRGVSTDTLTLAELKNETHCDTCNINYGTDLASSIEARFTVHPSIRLARNETYCIGGPANIPQILSQLRLQPNETRTEKLHLTSGNIRLRCFQTSNLINLPVVESSDNTVLNIFIDSTSTIQTSTKELQPGSITITITNDSSNEILFVIEKESWHDNAATAALVTSLQEFRDLFPAEAVAPGAELGIASIAVLFTDLRGSTALYKSIGDTKAFEFVQNHFRYLTESVAKHHGGILKTMGDAIMATFASGSDALSAAVEMQSKWNLFKHEYGNYETLALKIGIYEGSAIAINNKGKLDYFGTTVNVAGRLQKYSNGNDIIISERLTTNANLQQLLGDCKHSVEQFPAELKGLEAERFYLTRIAFSD